MPPPPHSHPDPNKLSELPRAGSGRGRGHGSDPGRQPDASESRNIAGENGGGGAPTACVLHASAAADGEPSRCGPAPAGLSERRSHARFGSLLVSSSAAPQTIRKMQPALEDAHFLV